MLKPESMEKETERRTGKSSGSVQEVRKVKIETAINFMLYTLMEVTLNDLDKMEIQ